MTELRRLAVIFVIMTLVIVTGISALPPNELPESRLYDLSGNTALANYTTFVRQGDTWIEEAILRPDRELENGEGYGRGSAIQGDIAAISSFGEDRPPPDFPPGWEGPGSLFIFKRTGTTWTQQQELVFTPIFGLSIDIDDNTILVSDDGGYDLDESSIHFIEFDGVNWVKDSEFITSYQDEDFSDVAISGDLALAHGNTPQSTALITHVYKRLNGVWTEQPPLPNPANPSFYDSDLDGNTAVTGNEVYVYDGTNWTHQATLIPDETVDKLGTAVAIEGDTIVISGLDKTFVFTRSGNLWSQERKLMVNGQNIGVVYGYFGRKKIDISGNLVQAHQYTFDLNNPLPPAEILANGSFEADTDGNFVPDSWSRKNPTGDGRRCNQPNHSAYEGQCTYLFKDDPNGDNKLIQDINLSNFDFSAGDRIRLTGFYDKQSTGSIQIRLFVNYEGLPQDQARVTVTANTNGYQAIPVPAITLKAQPTRIRVLLHNQTTSGKTWFDAMSLSLVPDTGLNINDALIPLPLPLPDQKLSTFSN